MANDGPAIEEGETFRHEGTETDVTILAVATHTFDGHPVPADVDRMVKFQRADTGGRYWVPARELAFRLAGVPDPDPQA